MLLVFAQKVSHFPARKGSFKVGQPETRNTENRNGVWILAKPEIQKNLCGLHLARNVIFCLFTFRVMQNIFGEVMGMQE